MKTNHKTAKWVLPIIILSQFCCTSLWFAGNSIINDLIKHFNLSTDSLGYISSSVQFGFIIGTLIFAILTLSDRFSPSKIFFICAIVGAIFNFGLIYTNNTIVTLLTFRFFTGFSLAGIYPVGMKIAADYFEKGLGKSLSFLIAALVLGTALPYLIKSFNLNLNWKMVIWTTSTLAIVGGTLILLFVSNGPNQKRSNKFDISKTLKVFKNKPFRSAAFGYFGHMWELYAFWTFVPVLLLTHSQLHNIELKIALFSFIVIASGSISCIIGGFISKSVGIRKTAILSLSISGVCCLVSPLFFIINSSAIFIIFLIIWGMAVIADSPLFSTMVAQNCEANSIGTALTIVNCIGFSITIISIQLLNALLVYQNYTHYVFMILAIGPIFGLINLKKS
ncbi:MFS transporter [Winogradskyella litoriviva]|uniref:MFS transporter n=1 Tax=Winogradskyella litoriviva TaxID=1220182 RepID=A0ABX2E374_9FLAO|nr:MFS transporter [Winogradskyella litoriviva]NRD22906.1 MFS transporter [Winogradskyella litoriviva]